MRRILASVLLICQLLLPLYGQQTVSKGQNVLAITHVTVIDAMGAPAEPDMTVIISGNRIIKIGKTQRMKIPQTARRIDATGKFLIPGLWDMHVHLSKSGENTLPLFIANGITSVRDMGGDAELLLKWRKEVAEGKRLGPRIKTPGRILESAKNVERMKREGTVEPVDRFRIGVSGPEAVEAIVDSVAKLGVDFIKIRTVASLETFRTIVTEAKKHHLSLVGHPVASPEETVKAGQRSIEHGFFPPLTGRTKEQRAELFRQFATNKMAVVPTLVVGEALLTPYDKAAAIFEDKHGKTEARRKYLSGYLIEDWREQLSEKKEMKFDLTNMLAERLRDVREMRAAGVRLMPGTDAGVLLIFPGFSLHDELRLLVEQVGMTPMEALISATRWPAEFFGVQDSFGTIEEGKIADLVLLEASPLEDIRNTQKIMAVVVDGEFFPGTALRRMLEKVEATAGRR